jgi:hypothetical protein
MTDHSISADRAGQLDRILKLLALATGTTFAAEADSARRMAEQLMETHNITLGEGTEDRRRIVVEDVTPSNPGAKWEFRMVDAIGHLCGCAVYYYGAYAEYAFVGSVANMEAFRYVGRKIHEQIQHEWRGDAGRLARARGENFYKFCFGYAEGLVNKIGRITRVSPVLQAERRAAELWYEQDHAVTYTDPRYGRAGSQAGRAAGESASLHRGEFSGGAPQRRLT